MLQRTDGVKYIEVIRTYDAPVELKDEDDQGGYELKTLASDRLNVGDLFFPPSPSPPPPPSPRLPKNNQICAEMQVIKSKPICDKH